MGVRDWFRRKKDEAKIKDGTRVKGTESRKYSSNTGQPRKKGNLNQKNRHRMNSKLGSRVKKEDRIKQSERDRKR